MLLMGSDTGVDVHHEWLTDYDIMLKNNMQELNVMKTVMCWLMMTTTTATTNKDDDDFDVDTNSTRKALLSCFVLTDHSDCLLHVEPFFLTT